MPNAPASSTPSQAVVQAMLLNAPKEWDPACQQYRYLDAQRSVKLSHENKEENQQVVTVLLGLSSSKSTVGRLQCGGEGGGSLEV